MNTDGLQPVPRESNDKDVAAMLDELTIEANEESFVIVLQHGGNDVIWNRSTAGQICWGMGNTLNKKMESTKENAG